MHGVPSCRPSPASVFVNREGTPPSPSSPSTTFGYSPPADTEPLDLPSIHRDLALHMGGSAALNREQLRWLTGAFRAGAVLLVAEVIAWVVVLINQS